MEKKKSIKNKVYLVSILSFFTCLMLFSSLSVFGASTIIAPSAEDETLTAGLKTAFAGEGSNDMSSNNLLPGDIILLGTDDTFFDYLIPGKWSHTVIFGGIAGYHEIWATEEGTWVPQGQAWVVHSTKDSTDSGLRTSKYTTVVNDHAGNAVAMRVLKPGGALMSSSQRQAIVDFAYDKIGLDEGYDWNGLVNKSVLKPHFHISLQRDIIVQN
jgi:hypothetical protein